MLCSVLFCMGRGVVEAMAEETFAANEVMNFVFRGDIAHVVDLWFIGGLW